MARDMRVGIKPIDKRKSDQDGMSKNEIKTGGGYCGGDSSCKEKKSCVEREERPQSGIDYTRD